MRESQSARDIPPRSRWPGGLGDWLRGGHVAWSELMVLE